ncbi:uncharacterized protein LOC132300636 [Cornus florida]|uniref:uncharacterized protein LOC132300636 n=1 Tax=Cornus florida TaxID=4283 RepID=UPI0028A1FE29|nr:uncharacterized protein LOC132300636 [Cornus florida]
MEPWMIKILRNNEVDYKDILETAYGVEIHPDAVVLACNITMRYTDVLLSDERGVCDNLEVVLKKKEMEIVEKACVKLKLDLGANVEEEALDFDEYSFCCTLVEMEEIKREKDPASKFWFPYVKKDFEDLINKLDRFVRKWKPTMRSSKERDEEIDMLEGARHMLVSCLQEVEGVNGMESTTLFPVVQYLSTPC